MLLAFLIVSAHGLPDFVIDTRPEIVQARISTETFPPGHCSDCIGNGTYRLLRYGTSFGNRGNTSQHFGAAPVQDGLTNVTMPEGGVFSWHKCHHHYHNGLNFVIVDLLDINGTRVQETRKIGFCYMDYFALGPAQMDQPDFRLPDSRYVCLNQGTSPGWADYYHQSLDCQFFDITGLAAGQYQLRFAINQNRTMVESDYNNNAWTFNVNITNQDTPPCPPPTNDNCSAAVLLTVDKAGVYGNNEGATHEEPTLHLDQFNLTSVAKSVWYKVKGTGGNIIVTTCHHGKTLFDTEISIYEGVCPNEVSEFHAFNSDLDGCGIAAGVEFATKKDVDYYAVVYGYLDPRSEWGQFFISANTVSQPSGTTAPPQQSVNNAMSRTPQWLAMITTQIALWVGVQFWNF